MNACFSVSVNMRVSQAIIISGCIFLCSAVLFLLNTHLNNQLSKERQHAPKIAGFNSIHEKVIPTKTRWLLSKDGAKQYNKFFIFTTLGTLSTQLKFLNLGW